MLGVLPKFSRARVGVGQARTVQTTLVCVDDMGWLVPWLGHAQLNLGSAWGICTVPVQVCAYVRCVRARVHVPVQG